VFIDAGMSSDEAMMKWQTRREKEVRTCTRRVPQSASVMMADAFRKCNVNVHHSHAIDNDGNSKDDDNDEMIVCENVYIKKL
jgi:poly(A) polymerase Pap1